MSIRIVSNEQIRFDVDVESYNRLLRDVTTNVTARCEQSINNMISNGISDNIIGQISESIDVSRVTEYVVASLDYGRIIEYAKARIVAVLLEDERFKTLVNRGINTATVGFIDEAVERITAQMNQELGIESDV
jgi:hypothetical protein